MSDHDLDIQRIERPTREEFQRDWVDRNRPVILTGVASEWPAFSWTPEYLRSVAGDSDVTVHYQEEANFHYWYQHLGERQDREMKFSQLLELLTGEPPERRYYMTEHELEKVSPRLLEDVDLDRYLDRVIPMLFMGRDTYMPMHYHGATEALLCQLHGSKSITLYSPDQFRLLYPRRWYSRAPVFSRVDTRDPDLDRFPKFKRARPMSFRLEPGEILFIPVHWWHVTGVEGFQISTTCFWKAKMSCYTFPAPGLQTVARESLKLKKVLHTIDELKAQLGRKPASARG
jgi:hypothetical protein